MNASGEAVGAAARYYKVAPSDLIVVHDELDLPLGTLRLKEGGGLAGHNGLKSIAAHMESRDFLRLRFGIGRPTPPEEVVHYVLSGFRGEEAPTLRACTDRSVEALQCLIEKGLKEAMNQFHRAD